MRSVDLKELVERATELVEDVRRKGVPYLVTSGDDEPLAFLSPLAGAEDSSGHKPRPFVHDWQGYAKVADELRGKWPADTDSLAILNEVRR